MDGQGRALDVARTSVVACSCPCYGIVCLQRLDVPSHAVSPLYNPTPRRATQLTTKPPARARPAARQYRLPRLYLNAKADASQLTVSQCTFNGQTSAAHAGAIHVQGNIGLKIDSSTFADNRATDLFAPASTVRIESTSGATITNSIFAGCGSTKPCIYVPASAAPNVAVTYSLLESQALTPSWVGMPIWAPSIAPPPT